MRRKKKNVTLSEVDGDTYDLIARTATIMGFPMTHGVARCIVLSVLERIVSRAAIELDHKISDEEITRIASSPEFQEIMVDILDQIEQKRLCKSEYVLE